MRCFTVILVVISTVAVVTPATAQWDNSLFWSWLAEVDGSLLVCPCGDGYNLYEVYDQWGHQVVGTLYLQLIDSFGEPVPNFPAEDIWLGSSQGHLAFNHPGTCPDQDTDFEGTTYWTSPLAAGGYRRDTEIIQVFVSGDLLNVPPVLEFHFNSPDINGDLRVDLADVTLFATDYTGGYNYRSDFVWDSELNLADLTEFARHLGHSCP